MKAKNYICIEGNIGAGKTTLTHYLNEKFKGDLLLEDFEDNPVLPLFYKHPERFNISTEVYFLLQRFKQIKNHFSKSTNPFTFADFTFYKCIIFAKANLSPSLYKEFKLQYDFLNEEIPQPKLIVYLNLDNQFIKENIASRGREMEKHIPNAYLEKIDSHYKKMLPLHYKIPILYINLSNNDPRTYEKVYFKVVEQINNPYLGTTYTDI